MNFNEQLELGKKLITTNIDEALILFENLKVNFFNREEILFELGKIYYIKQNFIEAKKNLELIKNLENNYHLNLLLSKIYKSLNQNFSALKILLKLYKQSKNEEIEKEIVNLFLIKKQDFLAIKFLLKNNKKNSNLKNIIKFYLNSITTEIARDKFDNVKNIILKMMDIFEKYTDKNEYLREKNILLNEYEIGNKQVILKSKPRNLTVTLTNKCNLKCKMCQNILAKPFEISDSYFNEIKQLIPYLQRVVWIGGEVFLYKNFFELFELANFYNLKQNISTNATLFTKDIILKLIQSPDLELNLSIDSITKGTYENIRVGAKFEKLISNIEMLNEFINRKNNIKLCLNIVVSKWNIKENFFQFVDFCKKYKIKQIYFTIDLTDTKNEAVIDNFNNNFRTRLKQSFDELNIPSVFLVPFNEKYVTNNQFKQICLQPWKTMMIDCNKVKFADLCYELCNSTKDSLEIIWNSEQAINFRKQMLTYANTKCNDVCKNNNLDFQRFKT